MRERDGRVARVFEAGRADVETLHCRCPDELLAVKGRIPWFYEAVAERDAEDVEGRRGRGHRPVRARGIVYGWYPRGRDVLDDVGRAGVVGSGLNVRVQGH